MTRFIYSRVSTDRQDTQNQLSSLAARYPDARLIEETASGSRHRPRLDHLLISLAPNDTLIVAALDRLGRRCSDLVALLDDLIARKINLISVRENIDLSSISGRFIAQVFSAFAEMERNLISERTRTALAAKKAQGVRLGRPQKITPAIQTQVRLHRSHGLSFKEISSLLGLSIGATFKAAKERDYGC
jgi:DNA invertase Pin-like site-specific DNA recombinase